MGIVRCIVAAVAFVSGVTAMAEVARADTILAGSDLFSTSAENSWQDLSLPAGFFGPGSDPFTGRVYFAGNPLSPLLGPTDTAVRRLANANVAAGDAVGVIVPIEIVALSLVSVSPITVTHGGVSPELWNIQVCIDPTTQPQGTMTIRHEHSFGGTYVSTLPVNPTLTFTRTGPPSTVNLSPGPITFNSAGYWSHQVYPPFDIVTTGAIVVANPCSGLPAYNIPATSNFFAGFRILDTLDVTPTCYGKALTCEEQALAEHGILPSQRTVPPHEGMVKFTDPRCDVLGTPQIGADCGGTYCGDNTKPRCNTCLCPQLGFSERFDDPWQLISYFPDSSLSGWSGQSSTDNSQWHRNDITTHWANPSAGAYTPPGANGSPHSARFHTAGATNGEIGMMVTPALDFSTCTAAKFLTFYYINQNPSGTDQLSVYLSRDNGVNYDPALVQLGAATTWTPVTVALAESSQVVRIKFEAQSDGGTTDIGVDQVTVECRLTIPGATYLVGDDQPLKKLTDIAAQLANARITGNVIYQLTPQYIGTIGETPPITFDPIVSSGGPWSVTIRPGPGVTMRTTSGASATSVVRLRGTDYMTLDGRAGGVGTTSAWTIANTSTAGATGAVWVSSQGALAGATNNTAEYLTLTSGANPQTSSAETFGIASTGGAISISNDGVDNDGNSYLNNTIGRARWGIYLRGAAANPNDNTTVSGNVVGSSAFGPNQIGRGGIVVQHQNAITIAQNEVRYVGELVADTAPGADAIGIGVGTNGWPPAATAVTNAVVSRNHVHDVVSEKGFSAVGIGVASTAGTSTNTVDDNQVRGVRANGTVGDQGVGIGIGTGNGDKVVFNSLYLTGDADPAGATTATQSGVGIRITTTAATNLMLKNNAIWMGLTSNTGTLRHYAIVAPSAAYAWGTGGCDRNDYWPDPASAQATLGGIGTAVPYTPVASLPAWRTQFTPNQDVASLSEAPPYLSATNLHLQTGVATALESGAVPIPGITQDYDGDTRSPAFPDIGMDEGPFGLSTPGDVNCDHVVDLADLAALQAWLWDCGPAPCSVANANTNGNCTVEIGDFTRLERYLLYGGQPPEPPCTQPTPPDPGVRDTVSVGSIFSGPAGTRTFPVRLFNDEPLRFVDIPLRVTNPAICQIDSFTTTGTVLEGARVITRPQVCGDPTLTIVSIMPTGATIPPAGTRNIGYLHVTVTQPVTNDSALVYAIIAPGHETVCGNDQDRPMAPPVTTQEKPVTCENEQRVPFTSFPSVNNDGGGFVDYAVNPVGWTVNGWAFPNCGYEHLFPQVGAGGQQLPLAFCTYAGGNWQNVAESIAQIVGWPSVSSFSSVELTCVGSYTITCKPPVQRNVRAELDGRLVGSQMCIAFGAEANVEVKPFGVGVSFPKKIEGDASSNLVVDLQASPFRQLTFTLGSADASGELKAVSGVNKTVVAGSGRALVKVDGDVKDVQCGSPNQIIVKFTVKSRKQGAAWARTCLNRFIFNILSQDDPPETLATMNDLKVASIRVNGTPVPLDQLPALLSGPDIVELPGVSPIGASMLSVPPGYSSFFYPLPADSTHDFTPAGLALGDVVSGGRSVLVSVKHPVSHTFGSPDSTADSTTALIGFSRLYRLAAGSYSKISTDRRLLRLSGIAYDPEHQLTFAAERDTVADPYGSTVAESTGTLVRIDALGHADTLVWNPPTIGRLHRDPVRKALLIAAPEDARVYQMDSTGVFSTLIDSVSVPVGISRGLSGWGAGRTAVVETVLEDSVSQDYRPFRGRVTLWNGPGSRTRIPVTFNRQVQDCAFGPGGAFGTNLYLSVADSVPSDSIAAHGGRLRGTGKIMVMDANGSLTNFAVGLDDPDALVFDPEGKLYVAVPGGVVRIAATGATEGPRPELPRSLALRGPFPNPVGRASRIQFDLPEPAWVTIGVVDVAGRLVESQVRDRAYPAGSHDEPIQLTGHRPGVYFVRTEVRLRSGQRWTAQRTAIVIR